MYSQDSESQHVCTIVLRLIEEHPSERLKPYTVIISQTAKQSQPVQLDFKVTDDNMCLVELTEYDFPSFFAGEAPLDVTVQDSYARVLYQESGVISDSLSLIDLEIPLKIHTEDEIEIIKRPDPVMPVAVRTIFHRAMWLIAEEKGPWEPDIEALERWIDSNIGDLVALNELADYVLGGDLQAILAINEMLQHIWRCYGDEISTEEFLNEVEHNLQWKEDSEIPDTEQTSPAAVEPMDVSDDVADLLDNILDKDRVTSISMAVFFAADTHTELAHQNLATLARLLHDTATLQAAYNMAVEVVQGNPRYQIPLCQISLHTQPGGAYNNSGNTFPGIRPIPEPRPEPMPLPDPYDPNPFPIPNPEDIVYPAKKYDVAWALKEVERFARFGERYLCTYELSRQTPIGYESYIIYKVLNQDGGSGIACKGEEVLIKGQGFGNNRDESRVCLSSNVLGRVQKIYVSATSWTDTEIKFVVPKNTVTGGLTLLIPWKSVVVCNAKKTLHKIGNSIVLTIPVLTTYLSIKRLYAEPTSEGLSTDLYQITQVGKNIRADVARVAWNTTDALNGSTLTRENPDGSSMKISKSLAGQIDFPGRNEPVKDGTTKFILEAGNRCDYISKAVKADVVVGTKARIKSLTANGCKDLLVLEDEKMFTLEWSVSDATKLILDYVTPPSLGKQEIPRGQQDVSSINSLKNQIAANTIYVLTAEGTIRKRKELVTDSAKLKVAVYPVISEFRPNNTVVKYGDTVSFLYRTKHATQLVLKGPDGFRRELSDASGTVDVKMDSETNITATYTLEATNELIPANDARRKIEGVKQVKYQPTVAEFYLKSMACDYLDNTQNTPQKEEKGKHINVSYGIDGGRGLVHQEWVIGLKLRNAQWVKYIVDNKPPKLLLPGQTPVFYINNIKLGKVVNVFFKAWNENNFFVQDSGSVTYVSPYRRYKFYVTPLNLDGTPSGHTFEVFGEGRTEDEAKKEAQKRITYKHKIV